MIHLTELTEDNWLTVAALSVTEEQKPFLAPPIGILARGYVYRNCNSHIYVINNEHQIIGVALVRDFTDEPLGYDFQQFMIDQRFQNKGYGTEALKQILDSLKSDGRFNQVEVCVNKADSPALHLYEKVGFVDTGYIDEALPDCMNLVYCFK